MLKKIYTLLILLICLSSATQAMTLAQASDSDPAVTTPSELYIDYLGAPRRVTIADITVSGIEDTMYEDFVIVGFSGLMVGQQITIPGEEITNAVRRFWQQGLWADVGIVLAQPIRNDSVWLDIRLRPHPRIAEVRFYGMRRNEREEVERRLMAFQPGFQVTPAQISRAENVVTRYFHDNGFTNAEVNIVRRPYGTDLTQVILEVHVDRNERMRVNRITIDGNYALTDNQVKRAMRNTNERGRLRNIFRSRRFVEESFREDLDAVIRRYQALGFRDVEIVSDTVYQYDERSVNIRMTIEEGPVWHIRSINWVGNTEFSTARLEQILDMRAGDVYNQTRLMDRLLFDEDAVRGLYHNSGFLFADIEIVEMNLVNDSLCLELRVIEGPKATIRRVIITGNDRLYEDVIRRELRVRPGEVFSMQNLRRSVMEIAQGGHFDPEALQQAIGGGINPDIEDGTVDITFPLTSRGNDQIEFSAGWGVTGLVGRLGLRLNNFSIGNLMNPDMRRGIIPQGDGQTLILSAQTNGRFYQSYQFSFIEPWFGGRRPNHFSVNVFYSRFTGMNTDFYRQMSPGMFHPGMMGGGMMGGGMMGGGMWDMSQYAHDPNQVFNMFGATIAYGRRLNWPDDFFQLMGEVGWQQYNLRNWTWNQFPFHTGVSNSFTVGLTLSRRSIDSPIYTRLGSEFSLRVQATPPFSMFSGRDYAAMDFGDPRKYRLNEFHKWSFRGRTFTPLTNPFGHIRRTPVVATRMELGILGHYNRHKLSPFETFDMGGDGMTGFTSSFATERVALRGYDNNSIATQARAFTRLGLEFRYPFLLETNSTIFGVAFLEAGNAWMQVRDFNPFDLKRSAGVGARIFLPMIGLMGIDWAYGFDTVIGDPRAGRRRGGNQFHFVIGQEF